jgi:TolB-like protein/tetratricopeptide (TPR) repeat protein
MTNMASIIQGYEYDIFISYRQKDNKYDGWVTEFVENLKRELEATFKEDISVYFDISPHDGLLETHDVDASLKEKIKCLVFIPIISHTYCDPKSFAWEHEFKAFIDLASQDKFGLKVKIAGGNVTNRVLPVRIHDLDAEDIKLCESDLGGYLRGVEFIYRESGVNRSLTPSDDEKKNLNKTRYRNQINKVANAIKEIITGLKSWQNVSGPIKQDSELPWEEVKKVPEDKQAGFKKSKLLSYAISSVFVLVLLGVYVYPKIFKRETLEKLRSSGEKISVAVMPFKNMTNDTTWNTYQEGIQTNLISSLTNTGELFVRKKNNINALLNSNGMVDYASISPLVADKISSVLDADIYINGSLQHAGITLRLNAELIDTKTKEVLKSFEVNGPYDQDKIFEITDSLRKKVTDFLLISKLMKENPLYQHYKPPTTSAEAFRYFINGGKARQKGDWAGGVSWGLKALAVDSNFTDAAFMVENSYSVFNPEQSRQWLIRNYKKREQMTYDSRLFASWAYAYTFESPDEQIKYLKLLQEFDDEDPGYYVFLGLTYNELKQYDKAIPELEKSLQILHKWGDEYLKMDCTPIIQLGWAYHGTGQYKKEKKILKEFEHYQPDNYWLIRGKLLLAFAEKDSVAAKRYMPKYLSNLRDGNSDAGVAHGLGKLYFDAGIPDRAEGYFRKALSLEHDNPGRMNELANFLIESNRNLNEVSGLMDKAMELAKNKLDYYDYLNLKGWGLYKQGKTREALEILQKCWDEAPFKLYSIRSHYEEMKMAVASLK